MSPLSHPSSQAIPRALALFTVVTLVPLLAWDVSPKAFPDRAHGAFAAVPLALIAVAWLAHALVRRASLSDLLKSCALAAAFFFWAANQRWPDHPKATLFNDLAVALFVIDVFLAIIGWPSDEPKAATEANGEAESGTDGSARSESNAEAGTE
jgi:hypothetical protein